MLELGVNVDHIATLRQARLGETPSPVLAAVVAQDNGADSIVAHLREDRRHIQDADIFLIQESIRIKFNLEMSVNPKIVDIACRLSPKQATLVPEKRKELTTEGGLNVIKYFGEINEAARKMQRHNIDTSLFIDPDKKQIDATYKMGIKLIELHTGAFCEAKDGKTKLACLNKIKDAACYAKRKGLRVFAGHGLDYNNVGEIIKIKEIEELNIGYSIICRALFIGLNNAVREMKELINKT